MTYFIAYFELKNKHSESYSGFADVGNYTVPQEICGGTINVRHNNEIIRSSVITDFSGQSSNDYFMRKGVEVRKLLTSFIQERSNNKCVIPCIVGFIDTGQDTVSPVKHKTMDLTALHKFFAEEPSIGTCLEIVG